MDIKSPYTNTPYDILSIPDDPKVGVLSPDATRKQVNVQKVKVLTSRKKDPRDVTESSTRLIDTVSRLAVDAFLRSSLSRSGELDEFVEQNHKVHLPPAPDPDWLEGLTPWMEAPVSEIRLDEVQISRLESYNDPRTDLLAMEFDH